MAEIPTTLDTVLRRCAESVARAIRDDEVLSAYDNLTVIVEDKAEIETAISTAISKGTGGVAVLVAVTGFRRRANSGAILTGALDIDVSCHENPLFNRKGQFVLTAQCVAERVARILHWRQLDGFDNVLTVESADRADDNKANVVVVRLRTEQGLCGEVKDGQ